jgi:hypothetical protein
MRVTIAHNRTLPDVKAIVDRSLDDAFKGLAVGLVQIQDAQKSWVDNTMSFSLTAKAGFLSTPIKGTVLVTGTDVTIDADLGLFGKLLPEDKAKAALENQIKGLLT